MSEVTLKILNLEVTIDRELDNLVTRVKPKTTIKVECPIEYFYEMLAGELLKHKIEPFQFMCQVSCDDINLCDYLITPEL